MARDYDNQKSQLHSSGQRWPVVVGCVRQWFDLLLWPRSFNLLVCSSLILKSTRRNFWKVSLTIDDQQRGSFPQECLLEASGPDPSVTLISLFHFFAMDTMSATVPSSLIGSKRTESRPTTPGACSTHGVWAFYMIPNFTDARIGDISISWQATGCSRFQTKPSRHLTIPPEETTSMPLGSRLRLCGQTWSGACTSPNVGFKAIFLLAFYQAFLPCHSYLYGVIMSYPRDKPFSEEYMRIVQVMDFPPISDYHANTFMNWKFGLFFRWVTINQVMSS